MCFEPLEQRAGDVQREGKEASFRQSLDEGPVHVPQMLREDVIEVPNGLMEVHAEHEADGIHFLTCFK